MVIYLSNRYFGKNKGVGGGGGYKERGKEAGQIVDLFPAALFGSKCQFMVQW